MPISFRMDMLVAGPSQTIPLTTIYVSLHNLIVPFTKAAISEAFTFFHLKKYPMNFSRYQDHTEHLCWWPFRRDLKYNLSQAIFLFFAV